MDMKGSTEVIDELRGEGYLVNCSYLQFLLRDRQIPTPPKGPGGCLVWSEADAQSLRGILIRRGRGPQGEDAREAGNAIHSRRQ